MTGTCERRLPPPPPPPPPPPRRAAPHRVARHGTPMSDDQHQPPRRAHTDASMRASAPTHAHAAHSRERQWQLRSVSLPPQAVLPPPQRRSPLPPPPPHSPPPCPPRRPARVKGVDRRGRESVSPGVCGLRRRENLYPSSRLTPLSSRRPLKRFNLTTRGGAVLVGARSSPSRVLYLAVHARRFVSFVKSLR